MSSSSKPRVCVVGSGGVARRVWQILSAPCSGVSLAGTAPIAFDADPTTAAATTDGAVDGVWVCAETPEQRAQCVAAWAQRGGVRAILCEAPVAPTLAGVAACYALCSDADAELLCAWAPRFDAECRALYAATRDPRRIASVHCKHHAPALPGAAADGDAPSAALLFARFLAEDFGAAAFLLDEQLPVTVQATCRDTYGTGGVDAAVAHLEFVGGRSVLVEASIGGTRYESSVSVVCADDGTAASAAAAGKRGGGGVRTREERFDGALRAEAEHFAAVLRGDAVERVCRPEHCRLTARIVAMATESAATGRKVGSGSALRLLQIGCGAFGARVQERVLPRLPACETVAVITAANSELELDSVLARKDVDSVYICTTYAHASALVRRALQYKGKKVLCETPLPKIRAIQQLAIASDRFLMLAYHRRFDSEYRRAKAAIEEAGGVFSSLFVESRDVAPHSTDAIDTLYRSIVHDIDTVVWLLADIDCELSLKAIKVHGPSSSISITIAVWLRRFDKTVDAHIAYSRASPMYRQHVVLDGRTFGYELHGDSVANQGEAFGSIYDDAYVRMFQAFATHIPSVGQGKLCLTYTRTHELLMEAIAKATDEHELKERPKHVPEKRRPSRDATPSPSKHSSTPALVIQEQEAAASSSSSSLAPPSTSTVALAASPGLLAVPGQQRTTRSPSPSPQQTLEEFRFAVASHGGLFASGARLFKPMLYDGDELTVYTALREREPQLVRFFPEVFDQAVINDVTFMVMRNLVHGYSKPRVLNVKVGEPSDPNKMCFIPYGIRIAGFTGDKIVRRSVPQSWNDMVGYFRYYIKDRDVNTSRYDNIPTWLKALRELQAALAAQRSFRFRAASLLFVYDCVDDAPQKPTVHLIDMARTQILPEEEPAADHFICFGLQNLCRLLSDIHQKFVNRHAVFLVRHGYRIDYGDLTWAPQSQYPHDPPLSVEGMRQAHDLAKRLKYENIEAIVSSPFSRAVQTARAIAEELGIKYVLEPAFAEFMSVTNRRNVPDLDPAFHPADDSLMDPSYQRVGEQLQLENWDSMCARVHEALWRLSKLYKRIAIVSHRSTFQALLSVILGDKFKKQLQFASITSLLPAPLEVGWKVDRLNSYSHLSAVLHSPEHNPNYATGTVAYKDMIVGADGKILPSGWN